MGSICEKLSAKLFKCVWTDISTRILICHGSRLPKGKTLISSGLVSSVYGPIRDERLISLKKTGNFFLITGDLMIFCLQ